MTAVVAETGPDIGVPWHYGDPMREQRLLTGGEGVVDLSHRGVITVTGPDRLTWLHSLTTQHLTGLLSGEPLAMLTVPGAVLAFLWAADPGRSLGTRSSQRATCSGSAAGLKAHKVVSEEVSMEH